MPLHVIDKRKVRVYRIPGITLVGPLELTNKTPAMIGDILYVHTSTQGDSVLARRIEQVVPSAGDPESQVIVLGNTDMAAKPWPVKGFSWKKIAFIKPDEPVPLGGVPPPPAF